MQEDCELEQNGDCYHDFKSPIRKWRAHYICKDCGKNITLELVLINQADEL